MSNNFRLKRVLKVREIKEKAGQQRLAEAVEAIQQQQQQVDAVDEQMRSIRGKLAQRIEQQPTIGELQQLEHTLTGRRFRRQHEEQRLAVVERDLERRQSEQVALWQDRETLTRLEQDHEIRQRVVTEKKNQVLLDEIAAANKCRR